MRPLAKVLDVTQEECAEVIQAISKIKRFGLHDDFPEGCGITNTDKLVEEMGHVLCMFLEIQELIPAITDERLVECVGKKKEKLDYYLPHIGEAGYVPQGEQL